MQPNPGESLPAALARLRADEAVLHAEPDYEVHATGKRVVIPNNPSWGEQWGPRAVGAPAAWATSVGRRKVTICVIDTGIDYKHLELAPNMHPALGWNALTGEPDPMDDNGHGTHVAGIIGAVGNNGMGVAGMNWRVQLLGCKFMNATGVGYVSGIIACLDYCLERNATISNNSYGIDGSSVNSSILQESIQQAGAQDHLYVTAAGNSGTNNDQGGNATIPAAFNLPNMLTAAALQQSNTRCGGKYVNLASYSSFGPTTVHLAAPGSNILSTWPGDMLNYGDGTSLATPFVSGAAALLRAASADRLPNSVVRKVLLETGQPLPCLSGFVSSGMLDVAAAVQRTVALANPPSNAPPPVPEQAAIIHRPPPPGARRSPSGAG